MTDDISIQVNGEPKRVPEGLSVEELLRTFDLQPRMIVVEHNGDILRRERYDQVRIAPGDALELVHFVGGG